MEDKERDSSMRQDPTRGSGEMPGPAGSAPGGGDKGDKTSQRDANDIAREFTELGRQLAATARAAWQSERRQALQQDVTEGLQSLRDQLSETIDSVRQDTRAQNVTQSVKERVAKVAEVSRTNDIVDDVRGGLAAGLRELNDQLRRIAERLERSGTTATETEPATATSTDTEASGMVTAVPAVTAMEEAVKVATPETAGKFTGSSAPTTSGLSAETGTERTGGSGHGLPSAPEGPAGPR